MIGIDGEVVVCIVVSSLLCLRNFSSYLAVRLPYGQSSSCARDPLSAIRKVVWEAPIWDCPGSEICLVQYHAQKVPKKMFSITSFPKDLWDMFDWGGWDLNPMPESY